MKKRASERGLSRPSCSLPLSRPRPALNSPRNSRGLRVTGRPRASARRTAWSALGRFPVAPNLAALVFLSLARELPSPLGLLNKEKKYSESPLAPPNRTAPTSPSFCSTRATSCTASSAARRRTTTPGSSTSWTRVSFFFPVLFSSRPREQRQQPLAHLRELQQFKNRLPRLGALLPPLRRPHRLRLALPAAQVRKAGKE